MARTKNMKHAMLLTTFGLLLSSCAFSQKPDVTTIPQLPPPAPVSVASLGAAISLPGLQRELDGRLPTKYEDSQEHKEYAKFNACWPGNCPVKVLTCRWRHWTEVTRTPFVVQPVNGGLSVSAKLKLWGRVQTYGPVCPPFRETTEPAGEMTLTINARPSFNSTYVLDPNISYNNWDWSVRPAIKLFGIFKVSFGKKAKAAIDSALDDAVSKLNGDLRERLNFQSSMRAAWEKLHQPLPISENGDVWLSVKPLSLHATSISSDDQYARIVASIRSRNMLSLGEKPPEQDVVALPILQGGLSDTGFALTSYAKLNFAAIESRARQQYVGQTLQLGWGRLKFKDFSIYQSKDRLVIGLNAKFMPKKAPHFEGWLYLTGRPVIEGRVLRLADIDYRARTNSPLVQLAAFLFREQAKREIEKKLTFALGDELDMLATRLNSIPPRPIGELGEFRVAVEKLDIQSPVVSSDALLVPLLATGTAEAVFLPYKP